MKKNTYIIGDVGGHSVDLRRVLLECGASEKTLELPDGVFVILVGDLIDRGPNSLGCVELAHEAWRVNEGRYIQLVGNHEANWLERYRVFDSYSDGPAIEAIREWASEGGLYLSAAVTGARETLVCHAGITSGLWEHLGRPSEVRELVKVINNAWGGEGYDKIRAEGLLISGFVSRTAGVYWAEAYRELLGSWENETIEFDVVHGHSSAYDWVKGAWRGPIGPATRRWVDRKKRHTHVELSGHTISGVDPGLGRKSNGDWGALVIRGEAITDGASVSDLATKNALEMFLKEAY